MAGRIFILVIAFYIMLGGCFGIIYAIRQIRQKRQPKQKDRVTVMAEKHEYYMDAGPDVYHGSHTLQTITLKFSDGTVRFITLVHEGNDYFHEFANLTAENNTGILVYKGHGAGIEILDFENDHPAQRRARSLRDKRHHKKWD